MQRLSLSTPALVCVAFFAPRTNAGTIPDFNERTVFTRHKAEGVPAIGCARAVVKTNASGIKYLGNFMCQLLRLVKRCPNFGFGEAAYSRSQLRVNSQATKFNLSQLFYGQTVAGRASGPSDASGS
ncbi:hypothetical protein GGX14DRAFT_392317 [Mycena pura]|uniref:Secreted protein n=1 Tax=Mycena pura TaxID=153505 RepID=A0AAD6VN74_9AGAR|nr:hypothetical protein GGX14DRAFT_392317 [Mycena pura]